jgi:hypothetical protein
MPVQVLLAAGRLITVTFLLADKFTHEEHHPIEAYSLLSAIPIKELVTLEAVSLEILEYQLSYDEPEITHFKRQAEMHIFDEIASNP